MPKPLLFGLYGAVGGLLGALVFGELVWLLLKPPPAPPPPPQVAVGASASVTVYPGSENTFVVRVARERFDERMLVIRIIFHDRRTEDQLGQDLAAMSEKAVALLIANRLAEELGTEKELWVLEYEAARLRIWERDAAG